MSILALLFLLIAVLFMNAYALLPARARCTSPDGVCSCTVHRGVSSDKMIVTYTIQPIGKEAITGGVYISGGTVYANVRPIEIGGLWLDRRQVDLRLAGAASSVPLDGTSSKFDFFDAKLVRSRNRLSFYAPNYIYLKDGYDLKSVKLDVEVL